MVEANGSATVVKRSYALFSDDHGKSWQSGKPVPMGGGVDVSSGSGDGHISTTASCVPPELDFCIFVNRGP